MFCADIADTASLAPRLMGGQADPNGAWVYGRLEVFGGGGFFSSVREVEFEQQLGRRGVEVACRTLGFATGGQLTAGAVSGLPGSDGALAIQSTAITCLDDAVTLADCTVGRDYQPGSEYAYENTDENTAVALLCYSPKGAYCFGYN